MSQAHQAPRNQIGASEVSSLQSPVAGLEGRTYGPFPVRACREKVAEFVSATGDDPTRWFNYAPPGWAAAALFVVAPRLLADPDLGGEAISVIHGEQRFNWEGPLAVESDLEVSGQIVRIRERGGVWFLVFEIRATVAGNKVLAGSSTFLLSANEPPSGETEESPEPPALDRRHNDPIDSQHPGGPLRRSASRSDLIRYAAATRDWNQIHWDHNSAVRAGLPGIVVHGLLQAAWLTSAVSRLHSGSDPLREARFRFRSPLLAGAQGTITIESSGAQVAARLSEGETEIVTASMILR